MADELSYSSDDLYGQYGYEGNENVTFSALDAIISNLKVSSAQIENAAITSAHIKEINADTVTITNLKASNIKSLNGLNVGNGNFVIDANGNVTLKGSLNGSTGSFTGDLSGSSGKFDWAKIRGDNGGYLNFENGYHDNLGNWIPKGAIQLYSSDSLTPTFALNYFNGTDWVYNDSFYINLGGRVSAYAMEIRGGSNAPYIDFSNDGGTDFDARLILTSDNTIQLQGADFVANDGWIYTNQVVASQGFQNVGRKYSWTQYVTIAAGTSIYLDHNLGYLPIVNLSGDVGNITLRYHHESVNRLRVYCYQNGWSGDVILW